MGAAIGVVAGGVLGGGAGGGILGSLLGGVMGGGGAGGSGGIMDLLKTAITGGTEIAKTLAGALGDSAGKGVCDGADKLCKDHGMPKFVGEAVKKAVREVLAEQEGKSGVSAQDKDAAATKFADAIKEFSDAMSDDLVNETLDAKGDSNTSGSWYEALAKALGKMLDKQADKVKKMADESGSAEGAKGGAGAQGGGGAEGADGGSDKPSDNAELNAASQKMSQLMSMVDNILKTLGEGMSRMSAK